jgi:16S rRNA (guanine966-N2)-methyltransferase
MGLIRVIGGELRGRRIRVPDRGVRPTSERAREAVFDILGPATLSGVRVLDLYAGSGALGIEALSRGADFADFAEGSRVVARMLEENLEALGLSDRGRVHVADLDRAALPPGGPWRLVFLDPPYDGGAGERWLRTLAASAWPPEGGLVIYERRSGTEARAPETLVLTTEREYGDAAVAFYRTGGPAGPSPQGGA